MDRDRVEASLKSLREQQKRIEADFYVLQGRILAHEEWLSAEPEPDPVVEPTKPRLVE